MNKDNFDNAYGDSFDFDFLDGNSQSPKEKRGKFIVIEGIDGSGKSTQVKLLAKNLERMGRNAIVTSEPTNSDIGKTIRDIFSGKVHKTKAEIITLLIADRIDHITNPTNGIRQYLDKGYDVICDRYFFSNAAYQGMDSVTDMENIISLNIGWNNGILMPDMTIYIDADINLALNNINKRGKAKDTFETIENLTKIKNAYKEAFNLTEKHAKDFMYILFLGVNEMDSIIEVADEIFDSVKRELFGYGNEGNNECNQHNNFTDDLSNVLKPFIVEKDSVNNVIDEWKKNNPDMLCYLSSAKTDSRNQKAFDIFTPPFESKLRLCSGKFRMCDYDCLHCDQYD